MAKFRVKYRSIGYVYLDVEADTLEDAKEIAKIQMTESSSKVDLDIWNMTAQKMKMEI